MLLSAVSVLVVGQSSSEIPEGLMNNPVFLVRKIFTYYINDVLLFKCPFPGPKGLFCERT